MSLLALKQHLLQVKIATLGSIAGHFRCDAGLMRDMLRHWMRKGCVRQLLKKPGCGEKCGQCGRENYEIYEWVSFS